jgi:HD-GYP domain-containing protein (c-di-GMP phosphodiesterase class II)
MSQTLATHVASSETRELLERLRAHDRDTWMHSLRVARLAGHLAMALGWTPARGQRLCEAALLHDIGKLDLPDRILKSDELLDSADMLLIREHPLASERLACGALDLEQVAWVRWHHERPDGCGYPDRLAGRAIPDGAALLAIADSVDAMLTGRRYRRSREIDDVMSECEALTGAQFSQAALRALRAVRHDGKLAALYASAAAVDELRLAA